MLNYNFLASTYPAATASYNDRILDKYARALNNVFFEISKYVNFNKKIPLKKKDIKGSKFAEEISKKQIQFYMNDKNN